MGTVVSQDRETIRQAYVEYVDVLNLLYFPLLHAPQMDLVALHGVEMPRRVRPYGLK